MGQERLSGLALLHVHREIDQSADENIERFEKMTKKN